MKNLPVWVLSALCCFLITFSSCKKDKDDPKDLLTSPSCWKTVKTESRATTTDAWTDDTETCSTDDCTKFNADGTATFDEGATKCDPSDPQTSSGSYVLSEDGKTITITQDGFTLPATVEELTSKKLVVTVSFLGQARTTFEAQ